MKNLILKPEYDFLRTHERLGDNIVLLTLGGSHAYGTNVEGSDVDVRGCALNSKRDLLGFSNFEQVIDNPTDTVIYSFNKLISLILGCNPNTIEMLGCKPEHYLLLTDVGQALLDNRKLFLSKRAVATFGGYATQQLRRLENALARDSYPQTEKEKHILHSCERAMMSFHDRYESFPEGSIKLSLGESSKTDLECEIFADMHLSHYPVRDFNSIVAELNNVIRDYDKLNGRNKKKDEKHLNKHAMHLIRLYLMCLDILENEEIVTYREKERDFLLSIRNGAFMKEDGTFRSEFFDMVSEYEKRMKYASENTALPAHPDMKRVEEFVMSVNEKICRN